MANDEIELDLTRTEIVNIISDGVKNGIERTMLTFAIFCLLFICGYRIFDYFTK